MRIVNIGAPSECLSLRRYPRQAWQHLCMDLSRLWWDFRIIIRDTWNDDEY